MHTTPPQSCPPRPPPPHSFTFGQGWEPATKCSRLTLDDDQIWFLYCTACWSRKLINLSWCAAEKVCLAQLVQFLSKAHWFGKRSRDWPIWAARPRGSQLLTCDVHRYGERSQEYKGPPLLWHHEKTHGLWLIDRDLPVCDHALKDSQKSNKTWYFNGETVKYLGTIRIWGWSLIYMWYMYMYLYVYIHTYI